MARSRDHSAGAEVLGDLGGDLTGHTRRAIDEDAFVGLLLARLGHIARAGGDPARAAARYGESLRLFWGAGQATHFDRSLVGLAAPALTGVARATLERGTAVEITGDAVSTAGEVWWPVRVEATGEEGWVRAAGLEPTANAPQAATPGP